MSSHKAQDGFTWLELLVVVSLLTLLAALLVPVVAPVWEQERPATCLSHLRQVGLAVSLYAEDEGAGGAVTSGLPPPPVPPLSSLLPHPPALTIYFPDAAPFTCPTGRLSQWVNESMGQWREGAGTETPPLWAGREAPPLLTVAQSSCRPFSPPPLRVDSSPLTVDRPTLPPQPLATPPTQRAQPTPPTQPTHLAPPPRLVGTVPTLLLLHSSHATSAAMVLSALGVGEERLPSVVLIGGLEAAMYHCDCAQNRHFWDLGKGIEQWGKLNGRALRVGEKCLRSADAAERFAFADYQREIDAGRAVLLTFSFDAGSAAGLAAARAAQRRVSGVGVGYAEGAGLRVEGSESSAFTLIVQLPDGLLDDPLPREKEAVERLKALLRDDPAAAPRKRLRWEALNESAGNVVLTFVRVR